MKLSVRLSQSNILSEKDVLKSSVMLTTKDTFYKPVNTGYVYPHGTFTCHYTFNLDPFYQWMLTEMSE